MNQFSATILLLIVYIPFNIYIYIYIKLFSVLVNDSKSMNKISQVRAGVRINNEFGYVFSSHRFS